MQSELAHSTVTFYLFISNERSSNIDLLLTVNFFSVNLLAYSEIQVGCSYVGSIVASNPIERKIRLPVRIK
jgi:hypothetical protein